MEGIKAITSGGQMIVYDRPYLIAETAYNHQGNVEYLKSMVAGLPKEVDAVKFHLLMDVNDYMREDHPIYNMVSEWVFSDKEWRDIFALSIQKCKDIVALCDDERSIDFILENYPDIAGIEIHSTGLNDIKLLAKVARFSNTVILGIGGSNVDEIAFAVEFLRERGKEDILLMYGFQSYPTKLEDVGFDRLIHIREFFDLPVGYADHCSFDYRFNYYISSLPCAFGVNVIEKHFTLNKGEERIDYQSAVSIDDLVEIKSLMEVAWKAFDKGRISMTESELVYGQAGRNKKTPCYRFTKKGGEILSVDDIIFLRLPLDYPYRQRDVIAWIGKKLRQDVDARTPLYPDHFEA